jgi:thiamine biosynthesis protein ThiS
MDSPIEVRVNGKKEELAAGTTVAGLLSDRSIQPETVVVEVNLDIVERGSYASKRLSSGDTVEVLHFVGGG